MIDKPPLPATTFDDWPRIPIDESRGSDVHHITRIATRAADNWAISANQQPGLSLADIVGGAVREGLLHLLELGLIDTDPERLRAAHGWPMRRQDCRPETEEPLP